MDAVAAIPAAVANMEGRTGAAITRTVGAMRELDARLQGMQVQVGAISPDAAKRSATRHELATIGEAQWAPRQARQTRQQARAKSAESRALAAAGDERGAALAAEQASALRVHAEQIRAGGSSCAFV
jgi:hypothetical protein